MLLVFFKISEPSFNLSAYFLVALTLTVLEFIMFFGLDNLFLPAFAAYLITLIA